MNKTLDVVEKVLAKNKNENFVFKQQLDKYFSNKMLIHEVINVCSTPNILKVLKSNARKLVLRQKDLANALSNNKVDVKGHTEGHEILKSEIYKLSEAVRNPILVLRGKKRNENSVVLLTEMVDKKGENVFVPIALDRQGNKISNITTLYGKKNLADYLERNKKDILALNEKNAEILFKKIGFEIPKDMAVISYDDSIVYTTANVKYGKDKLHNYIQKAIDNNLILAYNTKKADKLFTDIGCQSSKSTSVYCYNDSISYSTANVKYPKNKKMRSEKMENSITNNEKIDKLCQIPKIENMGLNKADISQLIVTEEDFKKINQELNKESILNYDKSTEEQTQHKEINANKVVEEAIVNIKKYNDLYNVNQEIIDEVENETINFNTNISIEEDIEENNTMNMLHKLADVDVVSNETFMAQNMLGVCYSLGINVEKNQDTAMEYFEKSSEQNYAPAQRNLAIMLENQPEPDMKRVIELYEKAVAEKDAYALNNLACCYMTGEGVKKDINQALKLLAKAVKLGDDYAMVNLADCFAIGNGVRHNEKKAFILYKQSADAGNIEGMKNVAEFYLKGIGTKPDHQKAMEYLEKAAKKGDIKAQENLDKIKAKLSPQKHNTIETEEKKLTIHQIAKQNAEKQKNEENNKPEKNEKNNEEVRE